MSTKVYVGNLPYQTTESDLQTLFESMGPVETINVVKDRATGQATSSSVFSAVRCTSSAFVGNPNHSWECKRCGQQWNAARVAEVVNTACA